MNKPPAFQFYAADFLVDTAVRLMTLEERGAYITLLAYAWTEGGIPQGMVQLARLCEVSVVDMERIWPALAPRWQLRGTFYVNPRMEKERQKQAAYRKSQSQRALTRQASPQLAGAEPQPSSSSSSLTSSSEPKSKSGATPPEPEGAPRTANPMAVLGPLIRQHLYRGNPPPDYNTKRCAHVCKQFLDSGRYSVDDLREAILMVPQVRAGKVSCDESFRRFFLKHGSITMLVLNDRWGSGLVLDQLLHLVTKQPRLNPVVRDLGVA